MAGTPRKPDFITFTGADDRTRISGMAALSARYPIEWGILFNPDRQGRDPRFPGQVTLELMASSGFRLSAHLCGEASDAVMRGRPLRPPVPFDGFARAQLNHAKPSVEAIGRFQQSRKLRAIAQCRGERFPEDASIDWLHDLSGGRGIETPTWPTYPGRLAGYAGGIGPDNVLDAIAAIGATGPYWIDMESRIRTDDWLDLTLCEDVCARVYGR